MSEDRTKRLEKYAGREVKIRYNIAVNPHKPSFTLTGKLRLYKVRYYEVVYSGAIWAHFDDRNIVNVWDESTPIIDIE